MHWLVRLCESSHKLALPIKILFWSIKKSLEQPNGIGLKTPLYMREYGKVGSHKYYYSLWRFHQKASGNLLGIINDQPQVVNLSPPYPI